MVSEMEVARARAAGMRSAAAQLALEFFGQYVYQSTHTDTHTDEMEVARELERQVCAAHI